MMLFRVGLVLLAACGSVAACASSGSGRHAVPGAVSVVASTNVWGDIVSEVAGDRAAVTSIISDPAADPHSYEANARNHLAISKARIVVENGGGYDDFMTRLVSASGTHATVVNVVRLSGKRAPAGGELNEHVWYDLPTVARFAQRIAADLGAADPAHRSTFTADAARFVARLHDLQSREAAIAATDRGDGVAITEPVPLYMLQACGLVNKTPPAFSRATENGASATVLAHTLALFTNHQVKALVYNEQTSGPETDEVIAAAHSNHVAVVPVTETLPPGKTYLSWMASNLTALRTALS